MYQWNIRSFNKMSANGLPVAEARTVASYETVLRLSQFGWIWFRLPDTSCTVNNQRRISWWSWKKQWRSYIIWSPLIWSLIWSPYMTRSPLNYEFLSSYATERLRAHRFYFVKGSSFYDWTFRWIVLVYIFLVCISMSVFTVDDEQADFFRAVLKAGRL